MPSLFLLKYCNLNQVILTDKLNSNPRLTKLIDEALKLNGISQDNRFNVKNLNWTNFDTDELDQLPKLDFLIGSDVFFDGKC